MKKYLVRFMVLLTLAVTFVILYQLWFDQANFQVLFKALLSYVVITVSLYLTIRYLDLIEDDNSNNPNNSAGIKTDDVEGS